MSIGYGTVKPGHQNDLNSALANMAVMFDETARKKDQEAARIRAMAKATIETAAELGADLNAAAAQMRAGVAWDPTWFMGAQYRLSEVPGGDDTARIVNAYADATAGPLEAEAEFDRKRAADARGGFLVVTPKETGTPGWLAANGEIYSLAAEQGRVRFEDGAA